MSVLQLFHSVSYLLTKLPMLSNNIIKKNRVYAPIIIGITLLLTALALYPLYINYVDTKIEIASLEKIQAEKQEKINKIKKMQTLFLASGSTDLTKTVKRYNHTFNTSDIMEAVMINNYTKDSPLTPASISIGAIAIDSGKKLPSGLSLATISLTLSADTPDQIVDYLTYLTTESPLAFTIDSISLPLDTRDTDLNSTRLALSTTLGVYYYE